jgi:mRNA interferase MazF
MVAPQRGDILLVSFDPVVGHEQAGNRPCLVLTPREYNKVTGLLIACPITSRKKGYPFEVGFPTGHRINGVVLSDQVRTLDWRNRPFKKHSSAPVEVMNEVLGKLAAVLIGP